MRTGGTLRPDETLYNFGKGLPDRLANLFEPCAFKKIKI